MTKPVYIHYGARTFDLKIGFPVKSSNGHCRVKPFGGLWASRVGDPYGWKSWCKENDFRICRERNSFKFTLSDNAKIKYISCINDIISEPWFKAESIDILNSIDYKQLLSEGYDGIEVTNIEPLYFAMYGWDCNSIVVLNPNIVEVISKEKRKMK